MNADLTASTAQAALARRVSWRCRRGLLELDIVLQRFVTRNYRALDVEQVAVFDRLLDRTDNDLWDLLCGRGRPACPQEAAILDKMRHDSGDTALGEAA